MVGKRSLLMKIKGREKPLKLKKCDAIIPRLRPGFPKILEMKKEQSKAYKGYIGEQKVDYHTDFLDINATILYGVYLEINGKNVQIDTLVITDHAIFIVEVKNYNNTIIFDTILRQFTRDDGKKITGFRHPITQAELQQLKLQQWIHKHNLPNIPVYFFIAISDPSTVIKVIGDSEAIARVVAHGENIPKKIVEKDTYLANNGYAKLPRQKIGGMILEDCKEEDFDIMMKYGVKSSDLLPGVRCPKCERLGMERVRNCWHCKKCDHKSRYAHRRAIADYLLLVRPWISNSECMHFLHFNSKNIATRLLKDVDLFYDKDRRRWYKK